MRLNPSGLQDFLWAGPKEVRPRRPPELILRRTRSAVRRVPMTVVGTAQKPQIPGIGATAQRIRQDVVYLDQMP